MSHFYRKMNAYLCRLKTDRHHFMEIMSRYLKDRQYMWYKVRELQAKGFNKTQIGKCLGLNRKTVRKYLAMNQEEFAGRQASHRKYALKLEKYENYVRGILEEYPWISAAGYTTGSGNAILISLVCARRPYSTMRVRSAVNTE